MAHETQTIGADEVLNDVVTRYPITLRVLNGYGLDTCCGGALSLREAALRHDLDLTELLGAVNAAASAAGG